MSATQPPRSTDTRVDPGACWFQPAFGMPPEVTGVVPGVPYEELGIQPFEGVTPVHDPALLASAWRRVKRWAKHPAQVWIDEHGNRHVNVLGSGVYTVDARGFVSARLWEVVGDWHHCELATPDCVVSLDPLPLRTRWLDNWAAHLAVELATLMGRRGRVVEVRSGFYGWAQWALTLLWRKACKEIDPRSMRRQLREALALDPLALRIARAVEGALGADNVVPETYNAVIGRLDVHTKLAREAPQLSVVFELLVDEPGFPAKGEPLQRLRQFLLALGVSPSGWRMVLRGTLGRLLPPRGVHPWSAAEALLDQLRLLDRLGCRVAPPRRFTRELLAMRGAPQPGGPGYAEGYGAAMPVLRRVVRWVEEADDAGVDRIVQDLRVVVDMLDIDVEEGRRAAAGRPRWPTLVERALRWGDDRARAAQHGGDWGEPDCEVVMPGFRVQWLTNAEAVMREGRTMRHCVFDYVGRFARGEAAAASVFREFDGRHIATLMVRRIGQRWWMAQIAGRANRVVNLLPLVRHGCPCRVEHGPPRCRATCQATSRSDPLRE
jgi:hypothetical protein